MASGFTVLVRLKPLPSKARKGIPRTPSRYSIRGQRFDEKLGWYTINDRVFAEELRALTHNDREDGFPIFDVCTQAEANALEAREKRAPVRRDVETAVAVGRPARAVARAGAVTVNDVKPMIDGADGDEVEGDEVEGDGDGDGDEFAETDSVIGKIEGGTQELDDGDDLLTSNREPRAPKITLDAEAPAPAKGRGRASAKKDEATESAKPRTRAKSKE